MVLWLLFGETAMKSKKARTAGVFSLSPAERRVVRAERIRVSAARPYGWLARSESGGERGYHLSLEPQTRRLVC